MNLLLPLTQPNGSPIYDSFGNPMLASSVVIKKILVILPRSVTELVAMASLAQKIQSSPADFSVSEEEQKVLTEAIKMSGPYVKRAIEADSQ